MYHIKSGQILQKAGRKSQHSCPETSLGKDGENMSTWLLKAKQNRKLLYVQQISLSTIICCPSFAIMSVFICECSNVTQL